MFRLAVAFVIIMGLILFNPIFVKAEELYLLGGVVTNNKDHETSHSGEALYKDNLCEYVSLSFGWLNEGHFTGHHRDGQTIQAWVSKEALSRRLLFAAGVGPYISFDTEECNNQSHKDAHQWGGVLSFSATYYTQTRWLYQICANRVWVRDNFGTYSFLLGIGYQLDPACSSFFKLDEPNDHSTNNEITIFYGRTILNSFSSETAYATEIEYRRRIFPYLDWTLGWIYEGDMDISRRNGIASQVWPNRTFSNDRLSLGLGLGVYAEVENGDNENSGGGETYLTGLLTVTTSYDISPRFLVRFSVNRTITNYDRDTDILLAGLGYRF